MGVTSLGTTLRYDMVGNFKDAVGQAGGSVVMNNAAEMVPSMIVISLEY